MPKLIEPLEKAVEAKPHRPVYRMHRYFARRPYSVFSELISHYTSPNDIVLDPFCGGGVTLVEGILQARRVIGYDVNPLAAFITKMELSELELAEFDGARTRVLRRFSRWNEESFKTICRKCKSHVVAHWFEYSAVARCISCDKQFNISAAQKCGVGIWKCPHCRKPVHFVVTADCKFRVVSVFYSCEDCGREEVAPSTEGDLRTEKRISKRLPLKGSRDLFVPSHEIPDCNMQRESALHKKGIRQFRQLFTNRHLLSLSKLRQEILKEKGLIRDWLLFAFSSTLRYTNVMVTRNPAWRGDKPLEWAKPGFWLPPVHLEANVSEQFKARCAAVVRGKADYQGKLPPLFRPHACLTGEEVLKSAGPAFHASARSSTVLPLPSASIDAIITDPPYGSYVHYADLCNFWSVWLPDELGLGKIIDDHEEAVIARKTFPRAKDAHRYQELLESCLRECARVLKPEGYMVLTFNNREPRAWASLLIAATKAGFHLAPNGVLFQDGVQGYKHTAQSRRDGSVIGDFILSFQKKTRVSLGQLTGARMPIEDLFIATADKILSRCGSLTPNELMTKLYMEIQPYLVERIYAALASVNDDSSTEDLVRDFDSIQLFDSHRRQLMERHFDYSDGRWQLRAQ